MTLLPLIIVTVVEARRRRKVNSNSHSVKSELVELNYKRYKSSQIGQRKGTKATRKRTGDLTKRQTTPTISPTLIPVTCRWKEKWQFQ